MPGSQRARYHHGDLSRAIRDTALALTAERGLPSFTIRELAARIGVAHTAVYAHYAGKPALLEALAVEGLASLNRAQRAARARESRGPLAQLIAIARAYIRFAEREPGAYRLVFMTDIEALNPAHVRAARAGAAGLMLEVLDECRSAGLLVDAHPEALAVAVWGPAHGLAHLMISGHLEEMPAAAAARAQTVSLALTSAVRGVLSTAGRDALETLDRGPKTRAGNP